VIALARRADFVIHAGDFTSLYCLEQLSSIAPLFAVRGNMDGISLVARLPEKTVIEADGLKIGVIHGSGNPAKAMRSARDAFVNPDLIIFGHTHVPVIQQLDDVKMINPGSPTQARSVIGGTVGWLTISSAGFNCRILTLDSDLNGELYADV
jgi:uncharacterized protein